MVDFKIQLLNKRILIVEDDYYNAEYLRALLTPIGSINIFAENGNKGVEIANTQNIDLILMDVRLPDISGYEAVKQIRSTKPKIKIVSQSAY